ncbi:MAG TPA: 6-bladed beta-propeller [Acidobacteriota bacterium]
MQIERSVISLALLGCFACGGPSPEFADWTISVPEGVTVHEYPAVPSDERADSRIDVVEDLVLGSDADPQRAFYRPQRVVPDADGNIYVLEQGNQRVQVFDARGNYVRTLGGEGQGPGELALPTELAVTADRVVVRADRNRLNTWTLSGQHAGDVRLETDLAGLAGMDSGFVARREEWVGALVLEAPPARRFTLARYESDGREASVYAAIDQPPPPVLGYIGSRSEFFAGVLLQRGGVLPVFTERHAVSRDGTLYLTTSEEYQLHAYGGRRWALRVAWPRDPVTEQAVEIEMARLRVPEPLAGATADDLGFPERFKAIAGLQVDGHGHVYVFPFHPPLDAPQPPDIDRPRQDRPVDVYSADGEHLFSGLISLGGWSGALGDFVYNARREPATDEDEVVRFRLIEPF